MDLDVYVLNSIICFFIEGFSISIIQLIVNEHDLKKAFCIDVCAALHGRALYHHTMLLNLHPWMHVHSIIN